MKSLHSIIILLSLCVVNTGFAQELNVKVDVSSPTNTTVDKSLFKDLESAIYEFFNNNQWTGEEYRDEEKIDAQVTVTVVKENSANSFTVDLLVQSRRPVYMSSYNTTMLNYLDRGIDITYNTGQQIQRSESSFVDNFSSILTFYAYMIIGYDKDTFSPLGGDNEFQKAREIINSLPTSVATSSGWNNSGGIVGRNRYWMQENMLSPKMKPFRQFIYEYHRLGLDELYNDVERQRAIISSGLNSLQSVISDYPSSMGLQMFSDSKYSEIVDMFKVADRGQKKKVYDIMVQCDPGRADKYAELSR